MEIVSIKRREMISAMKMDKQLSQGQRKKIDLYKDVVNLFCDLSL